MLVLIPSSWSGKNITIKVYGNFGDYDTTEGVEPCNRDKSIRRKNCIVSQGQYMTSKETDGVIYEFYGSSGTD